MSKLSLCIFIVSGVYYIFNKYIDLKRISYFLFPKYLIFRSGKKLWILKKNMMMTIRRDDDESVKLKGKKILKPR